MGLMFHTKESPSTLNTKPLPTPLLPTNPTLLPSTRPLPNPLLPSTSPTPLPLTNPTPLPTMPLPSTTQPLLPTNPAPNIPSRLLHLPHLLLKRPPPPKSQLKPLPLRLLPKNKQTIV